MFRNVLLSNSLHYQYILKNEREKLQAFVDANPLDEELDKKDKDYNRGYWRSSAGAVSTLAVGWIDVMHNMQVSNLKFTAMDVFKGFMHAYPYHAGFNIARTMLIFRGAPSLIEYFEEKNFKKNNLKPAHEKLSDVEVIWRSELSAFTYVGAIEGLVTPPWHITYTKYSLNLKNPKVKTPIDVFKVLSTYQFFKCWFVVAPWTIAKDAFFWREFFQGKKLAEQWFAVHPEQEINLSTVMKEAAIGGLVATAVHSVTYPLNLISKWLQTNENVPAYQHLQNRWNISRSQVMTSATDPTNKKISAYFPRVLQTSYKMATQHLWQRWWLHGPLRIFPGMSVLSGTMYIIDKKYDNFKGYDYYKEKVYGYFQKHTLFANPAKPPKETPKIAETPSVKP